MILNPTLKQVIVGLHSSAAYIYTYSLQKRDLFIQYSLLYKRSKERTNETFRSFQKLNCRLYYFLICVETKSPPIHTGEYSKAFHKFFKVGFKAQPSLRSSVLRSE